MSSVFDHLHLKRNTAGSSNELSFDVLDAARNDIDSKRARTRPGRTGRSPRGGQIGMGPAATPAGQASYHGVSGRTASALSGQAEVERRKRARRVRLGALWAVAVVAVVGAVVASAYYGYGRYQQMQAFSAEFDALVEQLVQADECLAQVDELMASPYAGTVAARQQLEAQMPDAAAQLGEVADSARLAKASAASDAGTLALDQVIAAADARTRMLDAARAAIALVNDSLGKSSEANAVWAKVLDADYAAREAAAAANAASTEDATRAARKATQGARDSMAATLAELETLAQTRSNMDVSAQITYLETRIDALDHALATSDALLEGDRKKAAAENDAYNESDRKAAALAKDLPISIEAAVRDSAADELAALRSDYDTARNQAIEADSLVRSYLGR